MRPGKILSILMIGLLGGGALCSIASIPSAWHTGRWEFGVLGAVLFVTGGAAGLLAITSFRRNCRVLIEAIRRMTTQGTLHLLNTDSHEIRPLVSAVNEMVEAAESCMSEAVIKMKELEIQLKVATSERQHAQAIIYSISDAVLVTDTFDELVLANESAARTFQFDLDHSRRSPVDQIVRDEKLVELIRDMRQSNSKTGRRIVEHKIKGPGEEQHFQSHALRGRG